MTTVGAEVGHGVRAVVYAYGSDAAIKIPRPETDARWIAHEFRLHTIVDALGGPCPHHPELVEAADRWGLACDLITGPTLREALHAEPDRADELGYLIARIQADLFARPTTYALPKQRDRFSTKIARVGRNLCLPVGPLLDWMRHQYDAHPGHPRGLCHGDLHPANIILGPDAPVLVDWYDVCIGIRPVEVARTIALLHPATPVTEALRDAYLAAAIELGGPIDDLDRWLLMQRVAQLDEGFGLAELNAIAADLAAIATDATPVHQA